MKVSHLVLAFALLGVAPVLGIGCGSAPDEEEEGIETDHSGLGEGGGCNCGEQKSCNAKNLAEERRYLTDNLGDANASVAQATAMRDQALAEYKAALAHIDTYYAEFANDAQNVELRVTADLLMAGADWLTFSSLYSKIGCTKDAYTKVAACKGAAEGQWRKQLVKKADKASADLIATGTRTGMSVAAKGLYIGASDDVSFLYLVPVLGPLSKAGSTTKAIVNGADYLALLNANSDEYWSRWNAFAELVTMLKGDVAYWQSAIADKDKEIAAAAAVPCSGGSSTASTSASSGTG